MAILKLVRKDSYVRRCGKLPWKHSPGGYDMPYNDDQRNEFQLTAPPYVPRDQQPLFQ